MSDSMDRLVSLSQCVSTQSTKQRIRIFREEIPSVLGNSEISNEQAAVLVDTILRTVYLYDDLRSKKVVDNLILKYLKEVIFMKSFAASLVQSMEKHLRFQSHVGCNRLLKWSCLLLKGSQFASASKNALSRVIVAQASLLHIVLQGPFGQRRSCKRLFLHLFSELQDIYKIYLEELKDGRIPYKESPELIWLLLEFSRNNASIYEQHKQIFLDVYVKVVLNSREKPTKALSEAFDPFLSCLTHEEFGSIVFPSSVKMLKRNPEIALEPVEVLLKAVNLDLSKYTLEILSVVLAQARHPDEGRKVGALKIVHLLSLKSSNPDAVEAMFNAMKAVIGGSEGRLAFPYQRVGMVNAIQELSNAPGGKPLSNLACLISNFLLSCYKDDGNEEVKLAVLQAVASWAGRFADVIQPNLVSFFASGLKEKETIRRAHLRCLHFISKNADAVTQILSLLGPLIQLVKTGYSKGVQRLDAMYALLLVAKIAAVDIKSEDTLIKEKIWPLISQNEPGIVSVAMASKLSLEDSLACVDLLNVLLVDHTKRILDNFPVKPLFQLLLFLMCHPTWDVRKAANDVAKRVIYAAPEVSEELLNEFIHFLSTVAENRHLMTSDTENSPENLVAFLPSVEVMVKALMVLSAAAVSMSPRTCGRVLFCSHHPSVVGVGQRDSIWRRISKCLQTCGFDVTDIFSQEITRTCEDLVGSLGLMSLNSLEQQAAEYSLCTMMSMAPTDTYVQFEKHLTNFPDRLAHDALSPYDIQVFNTPEGTLSSEVGVYIAKSSEYDRNIDENDNKGHINSNHSQKKDTGRREVGGAGKRDSSKTFKKLDKGKTAKEEARELLLREEAAIRDKVKVIKKNVSSVLGCLGEIAISNPVFAHSRLSSMVQFVDPLLRSPILGDVSYETLVKLSKCIAPPLCNWALDVATALRLIALEDGPAVDLISLICERETSETQSPGLFGRIVNGLSVSCKHGPLPVDTFKFIFPIMERILLSSKKTGLHDDILRVLYMHMDPILPLPRLRMLSALYHVLGVVPAYQAPVGSALNELCLGLQPDQAASALYGMYAKDIHVRMACLNAVKCIPAFSSRSMPKNVEVATNIWIALHDLEKTVAEAAEDLWDRYGYDFGTDYSVLFKALSHVNYNVRMAAAEALAAALDEYPDTIQESLSTLFSLYIRDSGYGDDGLDSGWLGRQGVALALCSAADVLSTKDLPVVMTFLISRALADPNADVRGRMINAGILIIDKHGRENVSLLFPIFDNYLNKKASDEEKYDLVREGVVIFTGALAKHLAKDDPKVQAVVEKLLVVLNTPSEAVQRAVSSCLSPLVPSKQEDAASLISRLLDQLMKNDKYGERRGAAFGIAGTAKGLGISCLKKYGIVSALQEALMDRNSAKRREGALLAFECLCEKLGKLFEPYVIVILPLLLVSFSDQVVAVREAAECAARSMMSHLTIYGVKLVLPSLLKGLEDKAWRTKQSSVQLLGAMAFCAPEQLSQCLPRIVPMLTEVLTDTHPKVQSAGQMALQQVGNVIKNPEISSLVPTLLKALTDPNEHTKYSLDILLQTTFINSIDAPSLALLVPIVHRGLRERSAETKKKAAQIGGNMCSLVTEPRDMIPYIGLLLPEVKKVLVDPIPEVRSVAARAIGSLIKGMGEENFPDLVPWLFDMLKSDSSNVERSGAAQGLSEVLAALGTQYFEKYLPDIIRNCSHQKAYVRDGYLTVFRYLPRSLGIQFQKYLQQVLPAILDESASYAPIPGNFSAKTNTHSSAVAAAQVPMFAA
ncbi:hypothetical protein V2J09_000727 [Rumex salicifolius]